MNESKLAMYNNDLKSLIKILEESNIDELEVSTFWGKQKIRLRKSSPRKDHNIDVIPIIQNSGSNEDNISQTLSLNTEADEIVQPVSAESVVAQESNISTENTITIKAPLVGTFYNSPKPDTPPFISEGDKIQEGQIICIIEAMKIFNEIESEYSGKILKILVEDATPVEYDQDLLVIVPE